MKVFNIPTFLTLVRLILSPLMLPLLLFYFLPFDYLWINSGLAFLFVVFALTDFFDGFLARKLNQQTALGKILDPIADKVLLYSTLITLLAVGKIYFYWVVLLIGREFFVVGLRQIAQEYQISLDVSWSGKLKTFVQMIFFTFIILNPYQSLGFSSSVWIWNLTEGLLLFVTLGFSLYSAKQYYSLFLERFKARQFKQE